MHTKLAVHPNHEPTFYEEGCAQMTICKTGNSLQVMGFAQNLRWVFHNEMGFAQKTKSNKKTKFYKGYTKTVRKKEGKIL